MMYPFMLILRKLTEPTLGRARSGRESKAPIVMVKIQRCSLDVMLKWSRRRGGLRLCPVRHMPLSKIGLALAVIRSNGYRWNARK